MNITVSVSFIVFKKIIPSKAYIGFVKQALDFLPKATQQVQSNLKKYLHSISIPGFPRASIAPGFKLLPFLPSITANNFEIFNAVFAIWLESRTELKESIFEFKSNTQIEEKGTYPFDDNDYNKIRGWSNDATSIINELEQLLPSYERYEIELMYSYLIPIEVLDDESESESSDEPQVLAYQEAATVREVFENTKLQSLIFAEWLKILVHLPETADEWEEVNLFVQSVSKIAEQKRSSQITKQAALKSFIVDFLENHRQSLEFHAETEFFQILDALHSSPIKILEKSIELLKLLETNLEKHTEAAGKTAKNAAERRANALQLENFEQEIANLCFQIGALISESEPNNDFSEIIEVNDLLEIDDNISVKNDDFKKIESPSLDLIPVIDEIHESVFDEASEPAYEEFSSDELNLESRNTELSEETKPESSLINKNVAMVASPLAEVMIDLQSDTLTDILPLQVVENVPSFS